MDNLDENKDNDNPPSYQNLSETEEQEGLVQQKSHPLKDKFTEITEFQTKEHPWFDDPNFYKRVLGGEGEIANRMHTNLSTFLKTKDPTDKNLYKGRVMATYWELHKTIMNRVVDEQIDLYKTLFLRYGALLPNLIGPEHRKTLSTIILDNRIDETVWYCDEWIKMVATGEVNPLATDEAPVAKTEGSALIAKIKTSLEKVEGNHEALGIMLQNLNKERLDLMKELNEQVHKINHSKESPILKQCLVPLTDEQRNTIPETANTLKSLTSLAKNISLNYDRYQEDSELITTLKNQLREASNGGTMVDTSVIAQEASQIAGLAKICVGRQGNHFPVLASQYFNSDIRTIATRENVVKIMTWVEEIDPQIFKREFRRQINRVPPHVILIPCYGNSGACWEPYERGNKATSRGRIAVPLFPADLKTAVITALGMLRWETAKEMASYYWMEEGITGQFYQWFTDQKIKGDMRATFVENYVLWITKESEGMQKLEREVRGIFWRTIPFTAERRESLKMRGFVYDDLYKKDLNRATSDSY